MKRLTRFFGWVLVFALASAWSLSRPALAQKLQPRTKVDISKSPRLVLLIRPAEKPPDGDPSPDLSPAGVERAKQIPKLFLPDRTARFPRPTYLFATRASRSSNRSVETLQPLAQALHVSLNDQYSNGQTEKLAAEILNGKYAGKVVVVSWHQGKLPALAAALGVPNPPGWRNSVFDRIWKIEWGHGTTVLTDIPQKLLPGDSQ